LYEEEGISGVEFPVGGRFIDILAKDRQNNYVVIELKVSKGYDRVVGQLLRYMAWIETNQAEPTQRVRGIIIAREISYDLRLAASKVADVELYEYDLSVSLKKIKCVESPLWRNQSYQSHVESKMFNDNRSKKVILVSHCLLNQNSISDGTRIFPVNSMK